MAGKSDQAHDLPAVDWSRFAGIRAPTYTQTPDEIFDWIMAYLTGAELKVLLYITRRTFGFKKDADAISVPQICGGIVTREGRRLDLGTGLERSTVLKALQSLARKNLIVRLPQSDPVYGSQPSLYALNVAVEASTVPAELMHRGGRLESTPLSTIIHPGGDSSRPAGRSGSTPRVAQNRRRGSRGVDPQKTENQQTDHQETDRSKFRDTSTSQIMTKGARRQLRLDANYQALVQPLTDIACELGDEAERRASITRAYHLFETAGLAGADALSLLSEAKALTRAHQAGITKQRSDAGHLPRKNLMPYFFAVLESLVNPEAVPEHVAIAPGGRRRSAPTARVLDDQDSHTLPEVPVDDHPIWRAVLHELREVLTLENYTAWLSQTYVTDETDAGLVVAVPKPFHKTWLENKLDRRIAAALHKLGHGNLGVEYVVVPA